MNVILCPRYHWRRNSSLVYNQHDPLPLWSEWVTSMGSWCGLHDDVPDRPSVRPGCTCWVPSGDHGTYNSNCDYPKRWVCTSEVVTQSGTSVHYGLSCTRLADFVPLCYLNCDYPKRWICTSEVVTRSGTSVHYGLSFTRLADFNFYPFGSKSAGTLSCNLALMCVRFTSCHVQYIISVLASWFLTLQRLTNKEKKNKKGRALHTHVFKVKVKVIGIRMSIIVSHA